jgi:adenosine deaminase
LGVTIHAGEFGGAANIQWAIEQCQADRVGHGLAMVSDSKLLDSIVKQGTCIEVCLTSNLLTGRLAKLDDHPVTRFIEAGVNFVLCSDNPAVHQKPLSAEYKDFLELTNRHDIVQGMFDRQMFHAFR